MNTLDADINLDAGRGEPQVWRDESGEWNNAAARSIHSLGVPGEANASPRVPQVLRGAESGIVPENDVAESPVEARPNPPE